MKTLLKNIYFYTQEFIDTVVSMLSVLFFSKKQSNLYFKKQRALRKPNDCCYILCNGPSLSGFLTSRESINGDIFVVNFFGSTKDFKELKPRNYIVLDNILRGQAKGTDDEEMVEILYNDLLHVDWPMTFYYPSNGSKDIVDFLSQNKNISICIYNMTPVRGFAFIRHWLYKKSLGMPLPQNISNAAIFCALNAGYKKIYLYGVEHSWMKSFEVHPSSHKIFMNDGHFYETDNLRWFNRGEYKDWLLNIYKAMQSHFMLREYADKIGAKIINKTPQSFVEAYEFEEY